MMEVEQMPDSHRHSLKMIVPYWEKIPKGAILKTASSIWKCEGCGRSGELKHFLPEPGVEEVFVFLERCPVVLIVDPRNEHACELPAGHETAHTDGVLNWIGGSIL